MRWALIADIHGNLPALNAVLRDMGERGVDRCCFLGDYVCDFPAPNQVMELVRSVPGGILIRGNKEDYYTALRGQDPATWTHRQMGAVYWTFRELREEQREYLHALPARWREPLPGGAALHLAHSSAAFLGEREAGLFRSDVFGDLMEQGGMNHQQYLVQAQEMLARNPFACRLEPGVYAFGHTHIQWHARVGDTLFVNPGSCGLPLDLAITAPYTVLEVAGGRWSVEERRVPYDVGRAVQTIRDSSLYRRARVWCDLIIQQMETGRDCVEGFLRDTEALARQEGVADRPFPNDIWERSGERWRRRCGV